jgi:uncharacterized protein (DUF2461 family)
MRQDIVTTTEDTSELAVVETAAREEFNNVCYAAQAAWHNQNEKLHREFQDAVEDNAATYRAALTKAQRAYRNATSDQYENA